MNKTENNPIDTSSLEAELLARSKEQNPNLQYHQDSQVGGTQNGRKAISKAGSTKVLEALEVLKKQKLGEYNKEWGITEESETTKQPSPNSKGKNVTWADQVEEQQSKKTGTGGPAVGT